MTQILAFESQQQARKIEPILFHTLEKIYKYRIKRDPDFPLYSSSIHTKYYDLVFAAIRKAIELVHKEGIEYVGLRLKHDVYMTETDIQIIKVLTEFTTDLFFKAINKEMEIIQNKQNNALKGASGQKEEEEEEEEELEPIDVQTGILALIKAMVVTAITVSFAKSILSKTNQIPEGLSDIQTNVYGRRVRWICQLTERSCIICAQLHNKIFYAKDVAIPLPGTLGTLGTHPYCKCYLELVN